MSHKELKLQGDLRQAIETYMGDVVGGVYWDTVIAETARLIIDGRLELSAAARLDLAARRTGESAPDECPVCPGMRW
jgi:hypothetical protein